VSDTPAPTRTRTAGITGASGYLGGVIRAALRAEGWRGIALVRSPRPGDGDALPFDLGEPVDPGLLAGVDVLVHCAYDLRATSWDDISRVNVEGTRRLLDAARAAGVGRSIVISSAAAYPGTVQLYGRAKLAIEDVASAHDAIVVRPGLVYGPDPGGMVGALLRAVSLPVVPVLAGRSHIYTVHEDDLAEAIVKLASAADPPRGPLTVENPDAVPVRALLGALAELRGSHPRFVPFPWRAVYWMIRGAEAASLSLPFRADSLWGLAHPPPPPDTAPLAALGVAARPFSAADLAPRHPVEKTT
jgi:nucleoside-diphosphate-sugar epimerase